MASRRPSRPAGGGADGGISSPRCAVRGSVAAGEGMVRRFIHVLRLIGRLTEEANWTEEDEGAVARHFAHLEELLARGILVLAGKTDGLDRNTFGLVILEAESLEAARRLMEEDPALVAGIMTAELYPYTIALMRG